MRININVIGGNRRIYILKDGAWNSKYQKSFENTYSKIELVEKLLQITLTSPSYGTLSTAKIMLENMETDKYLYIRFNKPIGMNTAGIGIESKDSAVGIQTTSAPANTASQAFSVIGVKVKSKDMNVVASFFSGISIFNISEIWLEKSGGGVGVNNPFAKKLLKTLKKFCGETYED